MVVGKCKEILLINIEILDCRYLIEKMNWKIKEGRKYNFSRKFYVNCEKKLRFTNVFLNLSYEYVNFSIILYSKEKECCIIDTEFKMILILNK
jgi:hypothetical protein